MALKLPAPEAAKIAIQSIGCGYDISLDLRLKYCKRDSTNSRLIEIHEEPGEEIVLPGGILIPNVSIAIKCDKGECTRFRSDVLSFQQMSEQFNQEMLLTGKIPSGLFNAMFEFTGSWQKDAAHTKTLAFDGVFITLYTVALDKSQMVLSDHVKKAVPSSWDPVALARFIEKFGTHIIVGVKMGGRDVIYMKQQHSSSLQPSHVQKWLKTIADKRFVDAGGQSGMDSEQTYQKDEFQVREQRLRFADTSPSSSYSYKEDIVSICKRRGGNDNKNQPHNEWLQSVQLMPDAISMSFIPITSLLNGVSGSGFLSHAINIYLRYKPPIEELHQFLAFQLLLQWAPVFSDLPLGPQWRQQSTASLQFSFLGPKLHVNTSPVDVGKRPVTGLRLYLEGKKSNRLAIHMQHLSSLPKLLQLEDDPNGNFCQESYDRRYYEKVQWKNFSHICTAPVESDEDLSIVTGAQFRVGDYGFKKVLFLRLRFSTVRGAVAVKNPEWDGSPGLARKSGLISTLISHHFTAAQKTPPRIMGLASGCRRGWFSPLKPHHNSSATFCSNISSKSSSFSSYYFLPTSGKFEFYGPGRMVYFRCSKSMFGAARRSALPESERSDKSADDNDARDGNNQQLRYKNEFGKDGPSPTREVTTVIEEADPEGNTAIISACFVGLLTGIGVVIFNNADSMLLSLVAFSQ